MRYNLHYGKRCQEVYVDEIDQYCIDYSSTPLDHVLRRISKKHHVSTRQLRRWYYHFLNWGEYQYQTKLKVKLFRKKNRTCLRAKTVTDEIVQALQEILDENPEYYLDEIAEELVKRVGVYLPFSTIYETMTKRMGFSLQVCYEAAKQQNEMERRLYKEALKCVVKNAGQVLVIDEVHKDKKASRRRRAWGKRNSGGVALRKWFRNEVRYTMIAGFNIDGFMQSTVGIFPRDEISEEGAAGTVDGETFRKWLREKICPKLGDYRKRERNSIVIMDNASTHMGHEVRDMILERGALLIYSAPYSPDLSPIEYGFNIYKSYLKRFSKDFAPNEWYKLHLNALNAVSSDTAIKEFRKCGIPGSFNILTNNEKNSLMYSYLK